MDILRSVMHSEWKQIWRKVFLDFSYRRNPIGFRYMVHISRCGSHICTLHNWHASHAVKGCRIIVDVHHRGSRDSSGSSWTGSSRQSSTEVDCRYSNDPRPWSSTDSDSSYQWTSPTVKPCQPASNSWDTRGSGVSSSTWKITLSDFWTHHSKLKM